MKRSVPKGDKKRKKEATLEISRLEKELSERHKKEIEECKLESVLVKSLCNIQNIVLTLSLLTVPNPKLTNLPK